MNYIKNNIGIFSLQDVSEAFKINAQTLRRYIRESKLQAYKVGGVYYVTKDNLVKHFTNG
jgi:predicted site-specific integrase-resolvase